MCPYVVTEPCGTSWIARYTSVYHDAASLDLGMVSDVYIVLGHDRAL